MCVAPWGSWVENQVAASTIAIVLDHQSSRPVQHLFESDPVLLFRVLFNKPKCLNFPYSIPVWCHSINSGTRVLRLGEDTAEAKANIYQWYEGTRSFLAHELSCWKSSLPLPPSPHPTGFVCMLQLCHGATDCDSRHNWLEPRVCLVHKPGNSNPCHHFCFFFDGGLVLHVSHSRSCGNRVGQRLLLDSPPVPGSLEPTLIL